MWYLYLDESGDLGFDFVNKKPSKFFTITILVVKGREANRKLIKAVKTIIRRKLKDPKKSNRAIQELKGTTTQIKIKRSFNKIVKQIPFEVYSVTLDKKRAFERLTMNKSRTYSYIARKVLDHIPFEENRGDRVELILDKSMAKPEIWEFNSYIRRHLEGRIPPNVPFDIYHWRSHENFGIQAVDLFCWGIFQEYERNNAEWLEIYRDKVRYNQLFQ